MIVPSNIPWNILVSWWLTIMIHKSDSLLKSVFAHQQTTTNEPTGSLFSEVMALVEPNRISMDKYFVPHEASNRLGLCGVK